MKTTTLAILALGVLAAGPSWAQQSGSGNPRPYPSQLDQRSYLSPGEPLAAAETTKAYVPNRDVVMAVEQRLAQLGYQVTPDGNYDANLRNNVLRFQSEHGLRPTGDVDLSTIGALGINVEPRGMVARAPQTATTTTTTTTATTQQTAQMPPAYELPLERSEFMSSPQVRRQSGELESTNGLRLSPNEIQVGEQPPAFPPGFPTEDIYQ
ncbi:MAG: peptidoglycan-binding protein [Magnetospirillum sp.]|nr:peptidoglycan-binding protein [Magnetospirillum sp.]